MTATLLPPTRDQLEQATKRVLKRGEHDKADLLQVDLGAGPMIVKDFRSKSAWVRLIGRVMIAREARAYRRLRGFDGVPRFVGRIDAHALAIELIEATPLYCHPERTKNGAEKLRQLREILDGLHARGLVHGDLRSRENVILDRRGRLYVLDLASAIWLRPGGVAHRLLFRWLKLVDESAYLKWKEITAAGPYTEDEEAFVDRFRFLRPFWLHRRRAWRGGRERSRS